MEEKRIGKLELRCPSSPLLSKKIQVDVAIIGADFTGVAAADLGHSARDCEENSCKGHSLFYHSSIITKTFNYWPRRKMPLEPIKKLSSSILIQSRWDSN